MTGIIVNPLNVIERLPDARFNQSGDLLRLTGDLNPTGHEGKVIGITGGVADYLTVDVLPPGYDGVQSLTAQLAFSYGDASPEFIVTIPAGKVIASVQLSISTPFDGTGAVLTVGDSITADSLMSAVDNDPSVMGSSTTYPCSFYGTSTQALLSITPGAGATQGAGVIILTFQS